LAYTHKFLFHEAGMLQELSVTRGQCPSTRVECVEFLGNYWYSQTAVWHLLRTFHTPDFSWYVHQCLPTTRFLEYSEKRLKISTRCTTTMLVFARRVSAPLCLESFQTFQNYCDYLPKLYEHYKINRYTLDIGRQCISLSPQGQPYLFSPKKRCLLSCRLLVLDRFRRAAGSLFPFGTIGFSWNNFFTWFSA